MTEDVEMHLDGATLVVRIPMRFQRRGGRKRIVAPDGSEITPTTKPQPAGTLIKALARAWRWQRMLDDGTYATVSEIATAEGIDKGYVSRVLRLALLAPEIMEAILEPPQAPLKLAIFQLRIFGNACSHVDIDQSCLFGPGFRWFGHRTMRSPSLPTSIWTPRRSSACSSALSV